VLPAAADDHGVVDMGLVENVIIGELAARKAKLPG
jgi:hypothetical protein